MMNDECRIMNEKRKARLAWIPSSLFIIHYSSLIILLLFLAGCGVPSFLVTPVANSNQLDEKVVRAGQGWNADKIVIVEVEGLLINARTGGFLQPTENKLSLFTEQLERAAADSHVKAVVLRVNSPGGTVTASDLMNQTLRDFRVKTGKPIVASTQEVAASGGYYVCLAADKIVVNPTSVVGSIGVIFNTMEFSGALDKLGIKSNAIKSGPLKDMASPFKPLGDDERKVMQEMVDAYYARFVGLVKDRRGISDPDTLKTVTDGRVFTGERAVELGLADKTGRLDEAIELAKQMGGASKAQVVIYRRPYGYSGSIYADSNVPTPQAAGDSTKALQVELPAAVTMPGGFYYLWRPGL